MSSSLDKRMRKAMALWCIPAGLALVFGGGCGKQEAATTAPGTDLSRATDVYNAGAAPAPMDPATVLVVVEGEKITAGQVQSEVDKMLNRVGGRVPPERMAQLKDQMSQQATENLILRTLLVNQIKKDNVTVTEQEIKEAMDQFKQSLPQGMTMEDLMKQAKMSEEEFNKNITLDLSVNKLLTKVTEAGADPTDEEIAAFYEENEERFSMPESVEARHVLIATEATDDEAAKAAKRAKADEVHKKLVEGADFAAMAQEYSDCPSKTQGGSLGKFGRGQMVKPFEDAAFSQETNAIGPVVETQFGYHIIQVQSRDTARAYALDEVKEKIKTIILSRKRQQAAQEYMETLKKNATISFPQAGGSLPPASPSALDTAPAMAPVAPSPVPAPVAPAPAPAPAQ